MKKREVFLFLYIGVLILLSSVSYSEEKIDYYADIKIDVLENGLVSIRGETNNPLLKTENSHDFTSKKGRMWLLNISVKDSFSDFIYELHMPRNSNINYIKTSALIRIQDDKEGIIITGTGKEKPLSLIVQYKIEPFERKNNIGIFIAAAIALIGTIIAVFLTKRTKKEKKKKYYDKETLPERQKKIVEILEKKGKPVTQKEIEKETGFPKSSLSRNIDSLARKEIIKKESYGMSNMIRLKEKE